nr:dienelactone hydrolase family protein [Actinomycetota bacterium]
GPDAAPSGPSSERLSLRPLGSVDGAPNGYVEYVPPGYGDGRRRPLLLYLHGAGENGDGSEEQLARLLDNGIPGLVRSDRWPDDRPFVVLAPQHEGGYEPGTLCPDANEIRKFLAFALRHYGVDRRRVYATGFSCGAIGLWYYLAAHTTEVVAAAVVIAGDGNPAVAEAGCALARVPIWAFHGSYDSVVSVYGSIRPIRRLRQCTEPKAVDLRLTVYEGVDHGSWGPTYDGSGGHDIYAWLLRHRRA